MSRLAKLALVVASMGIAADVSAVDRGQYKDVPEEIRAWFKSVIGPSGVPCCDISDGHRTRYDMREGAYYVPIDGRWVPVPRTAVIRDAGNPIGDAVVWYARYGENVVIRCFVPANEV
jgi:hypothetical protein